MVDFIRNEVILVKYGTKMSMDIYENMLRNVKHKTISIMIILVIQGYISSVSNN